MMSKSPESRISSWLYASLLALMLATILIVFALSDYLLLRVAVCVLMVMTGGILLLITYKTRLNIVRFSDNICHQLDCVLENNAQTISLEEETLNSKIGAKLRRITEATQGYADQSDQQKKNVQKLVSDISHQVKTPLSNIKIATETLSDEAMSEQERQGFILGIKGQVTKLEFLIEALVKISRLEAGMIVPAPTLSRLDELLENAVDTVRNAAHKKDIEIVFEESNRYLYFDMRWTGEALENILENAIKYTPKGGKIEISVHPMALYTRINVSDTGIGILPEHYNDVFKRFYRENRLKEAEGVGVGLYLAREILSRQGGYISVQSIPEKGATVSIHLQNEKSNG